VPLIVQTEYLSVAGVALATPAFKGTDLSDLLRPADQRGSDRVIPHGGVIAKPRRRTVSKRSLPLVIDGSRDSDGLVIANYRLGVATHVAFLTTNLVDPIPTGTGTRSATLVLASGSYTRDVHVEGLELGDRDGPILFAVLQLSIPAPTPTTGGQFLP
jgi:hypothetical protein